MTQKKHHLSIPEHIAIVMDGNRRWAKSQGLPVLAGHTKVVDDILEPLIESAANKGVKYMTFWAWSTENWKRSSREVTGIMRLFRNVIHSNFERLHKNGVKIRIIGDISKFAPDIQKGLRDVEIKTEKNKRITAVFALNYGGRDEIVRAITRVAANLPGTLKHIDEQIITNHLDTHDIPDPDIVVRPGGECRLSGFLLWQTEYSELYFPSWFMPEFTHSRLEEVLDEYKSRQRRFGE